MKHLENNHILYELAAIRISAQKVQRNSISILHGKTYDHGEQTDVIQMDIAKAFDTVPHNRPQQKLKW